jgi:hypothetical protein
MSSKNGHGLRIEGYRASATGALRFRELDLLGVTMRSGWIRSGLDLLVEAGLAKKQGGEYAVRLGKIPVSKSGSRDVVRQIAERIGSIPLEIGTPSEQTVLELNSGQ